MYDLARNEGWVSVGIDHDTAEFAAASIGRWWREMGAARYPAGDRVDDHGRRRGQQQQSQPPVEGGVAGPCERHGLILSVRHFPPGTSKWNKIEHRLFCFITKNWRGRPLTSYEVIVNLIANTTTETGLTVTAALDTKEYETGIEISDEQLARVKLTPARFHGEWNYTIRPHT